MTTRLHIIPCLEDNYAWLLCCPKTGSCAVIDPAVSEPVLACLEQVGGTLQYILNTHHHADHTGGNLELKQATGARVVASRANAQRVPGFDVGVQENDLVSVGTLSLKVLETPGHTRTDVSFYTPDVGAVFSGDCLFSVGCGRLFEGTASQMWSSMLKLRQLPDETLLCCGHEYTASNIAFAHSLDPNNPFLLEREREVRTLRDSQKPSIPVLLGSEKKTNPFLRADDPAFQRLLGMEGAQASAVFAETRGRKDTF